MVLGSSGHFMATEFVCFGCAMISGGRFDRYFVQVLGFWDSWCRGQWNLFCSTMISSWPLATEVRVLLVCGHGAVGPGNLKASICEVYEVSVILPCGLSRTPGTRQWSTGGSAAEGAPRGEIAVSLIPGLLNPGLILLTRPPPLLPASRQLTPYAHLSPKST